MTKLKECWWIAAITLQLCFVSTAQSREFNKGGDQSQSVAAERAVIPAVRPERDSIKANIDPTGTGNEGSWLPMGMARARSNSSLLIGAGSAWQKPTDQPAGGIVKPEVDLPPSPIWMPAQGNR